MSGSPPLRFLAVVLGGWAALRVTVIAPPWPVPSDGPVAAAVASRARPEPDRRPILRPAPGLVRAPARGRASLAPATRSASAGPRVELRRREGILPLELSPGVKVQGAAAVDAVAALAAPSALASPPPDQTRPAIRRWSLSAWSFVRAGGARPPPGGALLGGNQAGARLTHRLNRDAARPLALSARIAAPLRRPAGAEAALGIDWQPGRRLPLHLLAERRQALGREGRSAFALVLHGGIAEASLGRFRLDGYAQAGLVGLRSRDPFADGAVRMTMPIGRRARLGIGAWAAAQPGAARLEMGPHAALRLPLRGANASLALDWRVGMAGGASAGGGPALTLASDF